MSILHEVILDCVMMQHMAAAFDGSAQSGPDWVSIQKVDQRMTLRSKQFESTVKSAG
jgi:hypothetical protein